MKNRIDDFIKFISDNIKLFNLLKITEYLKTFIKLNV